MCLAVYIASDHVLPTVPWNEAQPAFHVEEAEFYPHNPVLQHVTKPLVYSAGTYNGCGCAFRFDESYNEEGESVPDDSPGQLESRRGLVDFLAAALQHQATVEVFTCCSGDESFPPKHRRQAKPMDFVLDRTLYRFGELVVVSGQGG